MIYEDRHKVLEQADMYDRIVEMIEHDVTRLVADHTRPNMPEEWDLDGIVKQFELWGIEVPDDIFPERLNQLKRDQLTEAMASLALERYNAREEEMTQAAKEHNATIQAISSCASSSARLSCRCSMRSGANISTTWMRCAAV